MVKRTRPWISRLREPVNSLTHLGGAVAAAAGLVVLVILAWGNPGKVAALTLYGATLVLMFAASGVYHMVKAGPRVLVWLRKLDHSAIYLLIAGTYTPICLYFFTGFWRTGMLAIIWALALAGIVAKLIVINAPRWVTAGIYLVMGWLSLIAVREIVTRLPAGALVLLALGGLMFTAGAVIYMLKRPNPLPGVFGFHEIWHIFVILGAFSHFALVALYVAPGA